MSPSTRKPASRKPSNFYSRVLASKERVAIERARLLGGLDDDIALARTKTLAAARRVRPDEALVFRGLQAVAALHLARYRITNRGSEQDLLQSVRHVFEMGRSYGWLPDVGDPDRPF